MDKELTIITEPEELIAWADTFDILLNPSIEDAAILLNYMEGHDYAIGIDSDGKMYRQYESLKADEKRLDRLFDKTSYGKELIEVATELADRVIAQLGNKELKKAAVTVAEGVREYSTGKRGR